MNKYTFKSWHNGAGMYYTFDVEAVNVDEAYEQAYDVVYNTQGVDLDVELIDSTALQEWSVTALVKGHTELTFNVIAYSLDMAEISAVQYAMENKVLFAGYIITHEKEVK